ncbi:zinc finger protein 503 [Ambystoma mexicanum]|uniref:zinc finger protein 503 n=1 Tax=Ambystoma mexicanum TaxID=8296 RepID=UPI0037E77FE4
MITSPLLSALRHRTFGQQQQPSAAFQHPVPPSDPARQAKRLPIKVLKMLTARSGHILHPEYLQPLPSTPVSPIELDAKKSPLALLAQTCSQIGKPDPSPSSKLSSVTSSGEKDKQGPLKLSDIGAEDKSSFKPYSKQGDKKESSSGGADKAGFRVPSAACQPFTPRTGSPSSLPSHSPLPSEGKGGSGCEGPDKKDCEASKEGHGRLDLSQQQQETPKGLCSESASSTPTSSSSSSVLGGGLVAPVSPYKPGQTVFPLPPAGMSYPGSLAGAYGYSHQFLQHGVSLDPSKQQGGGLGAQLAQLGCSKSAGSSPLARASPPSSVMTASLCRDPYCLSYHCAAGQLAAAEPLKAAAGYPFMYGAHPLHGLHQQQHPLSGHTLYPYGFMLPNEPQPHVCNWVSASGPCDKRFPSSDELLSHLRTHTAFSGGADKLLSSSYPSSSSLASAAAAAMACHMHSPGALALRSPHHAYGLSSRYHPYSKSPLPGGPGAPLPVPASAQGHYYSPYALYGQRLTTASALGYQ